MGVFFSTLQFNIALYRIKPCHIFYAISSITLASSAWGNTSAKWDSKSSSWGKWDYLCMYFLFVCSTLDCMTSWFTFMPVMLSTPFIKLYQGLFVSWFQCDSHPPVLNILGFLQNNYLSGIALTTLKWHLLFFISEIKR